MKKFIKINLIILVIISLTCIYVFAAEELDELQLQKNGLEEELSNSNSQIEFVENELSDTVLEISELTQKILDKQTDIETLIAEEEELIKYIEKTEIELEESSNRYEQQKIVLEKRLVAMYEMGDTTYLDLLLSSKGISEFLSNYYLISEITTTDTELLEEVKNEKQYMAKLRDNLETKKEILVASKSTKEKATISLSNMIIIKNNRLQELNEEELILQMQIEEYQNQVQQVELEIRLLSIANIGEEYIGGTFAWPVPGYTRITSTFGMRTHPITGVYKLHTGVDIGAPIETNFIAANDGVVIKAGYNTAYGNMVILDHGGGVTTLYAHGSEILVQVGDIVTQGTLILKVGSTGYSTGAHAHFEVRINGEYVEPLDYITSYESVENVTNEQNQEDIVEDNENINEN